MQAILQAPIEVKEAWDRLACGNIQIPMDLG